MLTLALLTLLHAAPTVRTDGVYLPTKIAAAALAGTASELDLASGVAFGATEVNIGYGMEDETRSWRAGESGLEVRSGEEWRPLQWVAGKKGAVKTDIKRAGELEELTFVAHSVAELQKARADKLRATLLAKMKGAWAAPGHTLELGAETRFDGKPARMQVTTCNLHCEGKGGQLCAEVGEPGDSRLFLPQGKKLVEVAIEGACGSGDGAGVELVEGGLAFERR